MPDWNADYYTTLSDRFEEIVDGLDDRLDDVIEGRVAPAVDDIAIGSAKKMRGAVVFFDLRHFSTRTGSPELPEMKRALEMLDCVVPMVMHVIYDFGGYVEKNTGDGVMAIVGVEEDDRVAASSALSIATTTFYVLKTLVNPYLVSAGIPPVEARIGLDLGTLLLARIGTPQGSAKHPRNFLTAVGPSANLACRLQEMAGTNEIWAGDLIKRNAEDNRQKWFVDVTPQDWIWSYKDQPNVPYKVWRYNAVRSEPS